MRDPMQYCQPTTAAMPASATNYGFLSCPQAGLVRLAMLQHLTVHQSSERLAGALEDFTDAVVGWRAAEPGWQHIQVGVLHRLAHNGTTAWQCAECIKFATSHVCMLIWRIGAIQDARCGAR
jgi:hypothetical protein